MVHLWEGRIALKKLLWGSLYRATGNKFSKEYGHGHKALLPLLTLWLVPKLNNQKMVEL